MVGELITLPVRVGVRATRLWLRAAEETINIAASATGYLIGRASRGADDGTGGSSRTSFFDPQTNGRSAPDRHREQRGDSRTVDEVSTQPPPASQPEAPAPAPPPRLDTPAAPKPTHEPEPVHVSEEPSLVEEFAEPGAEDGAGAEVRIEEPWDEYGAMNAKQVVARLGSATPAELAAVQLYESSHRGRQTVLNAVQRELRTANGRGSGSQQRG